MALPREYDDLPGTVIFDAEQARRGYHLNMFCMSLMKAENRAAFKADEAGYLSRFPLTEAQRKSILERDWNGMLAQGGNIYFTAKLAATNRGTAAWLRERTRLYYIVAWVGRWSMVDIFMESLLGALVQFGSLVTIAPGVGAVAFCAVVLITILGAEAFDPRLMWDAAGYNAHRPLPLRRKRSASAAP